MARMVSFESWPSQDNRCWVVGCAQSDATHTHTHTHHNALNTSTHKNTNNRRTHLNRAIIADDELAVHWAGNLECLRDLASNLNDLTSPPLRGNELRRQDRRVMND